MQIVEEWANYIPSIIDGKHPHCLFVKGITAIGARLAVGQTGAALLAVFFLSREPV